MSGKENVVLQLRAVEALGTALRDAAEELGRQGEVDAARLGRLMEQGDRPLRDALDLFFYRFIRLQDRLGAVLFRAILDYEAEEYTTNRDLLDLMERLEIIPSVERWMALRELRNALTHDYPADLALAAENIAAAKASVPELLETLDRVQGYARKRGIVG